MPTEAALSHQTTYAQRFIAALALLCDSEPSQDLCEQWLAGTSENLQEWVVSHVRAEWATGIGAIEAAQHLADNPNEGEEHVGFAADYSNYSRSADGCAENWVVDGPDGKGFLIVNTSDDPDDQKAPCIHVVGDLALAERVAAALTAASR